MCSLPMLSLPLDKINNFENNCFCAEHPYLLLKHQDKELAVVCYSHNFSTLLPVNKVVPLCLVLKENSDRNQLCSDLIYSNPSTNYLIKKLTIKISWILSFLLTPFPINKKHIHKELLIWGIQC